ncbi:hypothetical protein KIV65_gp02 [Mycobacterium phage Anthony]|uniref:Terminase small subunit n=1 Tax=Mycobacterium phage Anthony TaxID=2599857 RepID=A0A5J6TIF1_9CAUD|nr:hypothetical protein KIV65_gp02 [Mycobacterium phage Anthony]QFG10376.1 hypothetical protein PBI_ANTHONY_2 [Mycobacterium phage Anthony]
MGTRGPVGKRSDEKVRRNKEDVPVDKVTAIGTVIAPDLDFTDPHPITVSFYEALKISAQSRYYEPSDWETARFALHFADQLLKSPKPNGQILATVNQIFGVLMTTEGERRRMRLEIERGSGEGEVIDVADMFRQRLSQG